MPRGSSLECTKGIMRTLEIIQTRGEKKAVPSQQRTY